MIYLTKPKIKKILCSKRLIICKVYIKYLVCFDFKRKKEKNRRIIINNRQKWIKT